MSEFLSSVNDNCVVLCAKILSYMLVLCFGSHCL